MEDVLIQNAVAYASQHHCRLAERLGFGIHGIIFVAEDKSGGGKTAVKADRLEERLHGRCVAKPYRFHWLSGALPQIKSYPERCEWGVEQ